jgi:hypothetical protein
VATEEPCETCHGTGKISVPSIQDKIAFHLITVPESALMLTPEEVKEVGAVLDAAGMNGNPDAADEV